MIGIFLTYALEPIRAEAVVSLAGGGPLGFLVGCAVHLLIGHRLGGPGGQVPSGPIRSSRSDITATIALRVLLV